MHRYAPLAFDASAPSCGSGSDSIMVWYSQMHSNRQHADDGFEREKCARSAMGERLGDKGGQHALRNRNRNRAAPRH